MKSIALNQVQFTNSVAHIISSILEKVTIHTSAAYQEEAQVSTYVSWVFYEVTFCAPVYCLDSDGCVIPWTDLADIDKNPEDVTYLRLCCKMNSTNVDLRI